MIIFQPGDVFAGRFRLEERIGQGGMGQVWRATQLGLQREVALKLILGGVHDDARFREMFLLEARVSGRLTHPNIVPVVDSGEGEGGVLWLVQIFVHGADLGKVLERSPGGLPLPLAGFIVQQILQGLQAAHDGGVIHRDLKPGNVLVSHTGDIQITDFGIAKVVAPNQTPSVSTALKGSPGYLAPELLRGQAPRFTSDLFSVGGLFYELLTGRHPFIKGPYADRDQIFFSTLNDPIASLGDGVPDAVEAVVRRLLERDPEKRYATAAAVLDDLHAALAPVARDATALALRRHLAATRETVIAGEPKPPSIGLSGMAGQVAGSGTRRTRAASPRKRRRVATLTAITLLMAAGGAGIALSRSSSTATPRAAAAPVASAPPAPIAAITPPPAPDAGVAAAPPPTLDAGSAPAPAPAAVATEKKKHRTRDEGDWITPHGGSPDDVRVHH